MRTPVNDKELAELVERCKRLIRLDGDPGPATHGSYVNEIEVGGVRVVLEVFTNPEKPAVLDICRGTTLIYQESYVAQRPHDIKQALADLRQVMILDDLADV